MVRQVGDILYEVKRRRRKTADIVIERDGRVMLRVPKAIAEKDIKKLVETKQYWIYKNLAEWRDLNATHVLREYKNGEGFLYLGRSYRLQLTSNQKEPIALEGRRFLLLRDLVDKGEIRAAKSAFKEFYIKHGMKRISQRVDYYAPKIGVFPKKVNVKDIDFRWASCSPRGNLIFHWKCMMAPLTIIDYIVVHELCHLRHLSHSMAFWNEVDKVMPDYADRKDWLKKNGAGMDL